MVVLMTGLKKMYIVKRKSYGFFYAGETTIGSEKFSLWCSVKIGALKVCEDSTVVFNVMED